MKSEKEKMINGELYQIYDKVLCADRDRSHELMDAFNDLEEKNPTKQIEIIKELFGSTGDLIEVHPNFRCDYGYNIHVGEHFFANYDCVLLDVAPIYIGDDCLLAPRVQIYSALHPLDPTIRKEMIGQGKAVHIGNKVWIGGGAIIIPGVTLGNNVIVGAGSVVTKSFPDNVIIAGNPARIIRENPNKV